MLKSVRITNYLGDSLTIDLQSPGDSGLYIKSINGLGPSKATINSTEMAANDGSQFNSSRMQDRNIVMNLGFYDQYDSIETIRNKTYTFFPVKRAVKLRFTLDSKIAIVDGYVESNEPDIFSREEGTTISIICPNPYFYSNKNNITDFSDTKSLFEFPFENNSTTKNLIEVSEIIILSENTVYYDGEIETGVEITLHCLADEIKNPKIYDTQSKSSIEIDTAKLKALTGSGFIYGDDIIINTNKGTKTVRLLRDGKYTNILNCINKNATWFQLSHGDNKFAYITDSESPRLMVTIVNKILYEGV